jgi:hypothetical protein
VNNVIDYDQQAHPLLQHPPSASGFTCFLASNFILPFFLPLPPDFPDLAVVTVYVDSASTLFLFCKITSSLGPLFLTYVDGSFTEL